MGILCRAPILSFDSRKKEKLSCSSEVFTYQKINRPSSVQCSTSIGIYLHTNGIELSLEINPYTNEQLKFDKGTETTQKRKNSFSNKLCWQKLETLMQKSDSELPYTKINSKWIKNLNIMLKL